MRTLVALLVLLAAAAATAQTMYRSTMPGGRTVLSDRPMPGALKVEEVQPRPGNVVPSQAPVEAPAKPRAEPPRAEAERELREAQQAYDAAREARDKGKEELPGERLGTAGKGSRLSDAYWTRQKGLEDAVAAAEKRLQQARVQLRGAR